MTHTATYSPEDNKLRLYPACRLEPALYERVKAAGFRWAPKQGLFVAPAWCPARAHLLEELCGEIQDEDKSLVERAEERAERFEEYSDKREQDAERAHAAVSSIADNIPFGQPILVGHHSERRARKDAEKIENGMRRAVKMWECSTYWTSRARGAIRSAKYKELPAVRARRIKGLEADLRRRCKDKAEGETALRLWSVEGLTHEGALKIARDERGAGYFSMPRKEGDRPDFNQTPSGYSALIGDYPNLYAPRTLEEVVEQAKRVFARQVNYAEEWIAHLQNRLAYENAMLGEAGFAVDRTKAKSAKSALPICNYRAPDGIVCADKWNRGQSVTFAQVEMTAAQYAAINSDYKGTEVCDKSHRVRVAVIHDAATRAKIGGARMACVFLTDSKVHTKPAPAGEMPTAAGKRILRPLNEEAERQKVDEFGRLICEEPPAVIPAPWSGPYPSSVSGFSTSNEAPKPDKFRAMKETLRAGVKVVSAPQLFPTPPELARRVVELADIRPGHAVLEPSAGTGALLAAMPNIRPGGTVHAVEINRTLADGLREIVDEVHCADFLELNGQLGMFDRIVMNPPFADGADIRHIEHALEMLQPGGKLVAICANGPRQRAKLMERASEWYDLPAGSFQSAGTGVNTALVLFEA